MDLFLNLAYWVPTGIFVVLVTVFKKSISEWFSEYLKNYFSAELKRVEHDFKRAEIQFSAALGRQDKTIEHLQSGALSNLTARNQLLYDRRLKALDTLWEVVVESWKFKGILTLVHTFPLDLVLKAQTKTDVIAELLKKTGTIDPDTMAFFSKAALVRPYVSILVWAYYKAYEAIIRHGCFIALILQHRVDGEIIPQGKDVKALIHAVLPQLGDTSEQLDLKNSLVYMDLIEYQMLEAIKYDLNGNDLDHIQMEKAKRIINIANSLIVQ